MSCKKGVLFCVKPNKHLPEVVLMEKREQYKLIVTYDKQGNSIEEVFSNILRQTLLSCDKSELDSPQETGVQCKAQGK